jgi:hypothetical protein
MSKPCFVIVKQAVSTELLLAYKSSVRQSQIAALATLTEFGLGEAESNLPPGITRFAPTAASINLDVSPDWRSIFDNIEQSLASSIFETLREPVCDLDLCWLRTQFPPSQRPAYQAPHSWHQDGACGVDFSSKLGHATDSLAHMLTAWIPLESCGLRAPSIEILVESPEQLLTPEQLVDPGAAWRKLPTESVQIKAGDVLLMAGHCVHRTHVTQEMTQARNCIEFRFLDQTCLPSRFSKHRFVSLKALI